MIKQTKRHVCLTSGAVQHGGIEIRTLLTFYEPHYRTSTVRNNVIWHLYNIHHIQICIWNGLKIDQGVQTQNISTLGWTDGWNDWVFILTANLELVLVSILSTLAEK